MLLSKNLILEKLVFIVQFTVLILHPNTGNYTFHYNFIFNFQQSQNIMQIPPFPFNPSPPMQRFVEKRFFSIALFPKSPKYFLLPLFMDGVHLLQDCRPTTRRQFNFNGNFKPEVSRLVINSETNRSLLQWTKIIYQLFSFPDENPRTCEKQRH